MGIYDQPILGAEQQLETARRLREGVTTPQGQMVSGWYVPPSITQYMAEALKAYSAGKTGSDAQAKIDELTKQKQDETQKLLGELQPQANTSLTNAAFQPQDTSTQGAINQGLNPSYTPMTQTSYTQPSPDAKMQTLAKLLAVNPDVATGQVALTEYNLNRQDKQAAARQAAQDKLEQLHQAALDRAAMVGGNAKPYYQFLPTAGGYAIGNARTGEIAAPGTGGVTAVRSTDNPALQKDISIAKKQGETEVTRGNEAKDANAATIARIAPLERMSETVGMILKSPGLETRTGLTSYVPPALQGEEARNTQAFMDNLKSQVAQNVLSMYRQMSQTGGAVGQVSNFEQKMFQDNIAALDQAQGTPQFKEQLGRIQDFVKQSKEIMQIANYMKYGNPDPSKPTPTNEDLQYMYEHPESRSNFIKHFGGG